MCCKGGFIPGLIVKFSLNVHIYIWCSFVEFSLKDTNFGSSITISESKCICSINVQCKYSDQAGWRGFESQKGQEISGSGAHSAPCSMGTAVLSWGKAAGVRS
jgi:hypothetical protein